MNNVWAARFAGSPVMVGADRADWLGKHLDGTAAAMQKLETRMDVEAPVMQDDYWPSADSWLSMVKPYSVKDGTLYIPVRGMLLHDFDYQLFDWATGYTYVQKAYERGMGDLAVKRIALVINSGGGEVAGNFDLVDFMYGFRGTKPVQAFVNEAAYSAAYSIASVADRITMTRTGGVGSIGVVTAHMDVSRMMEERGVKVTFIHAGEHKVDGNAYEALSPEVKNRMQTRIDGLYDIFVATVSRNLGLDEQAIRDTEALTYSADDAISIGLAHDVRAFDDAVAAFSGGLDTDAGEETMTKETQPVEATQAQLDAARAEGRAEGATAERARINGILGCDQATNRREVAFHLAMNTNQTVEEAQGILAVTPEQKPAAATVEGNAFERAMEQGNPNITAEGGQQEETQNANPLDTALADYRAATGYKKED